jgi:ABC-type sugar transport system ATPase subunit
MASVTLKHVKKSFGAQRVIEDASLDIAAGEFVVFVGPSGCGKSTLLRMIAGLETVSDGSIVIGNRDVTELSSGERGCAMVFQSYALYPHMTVQQNLTFGMRMRSVAKAEIEKRLAYVVEMLQLEAYLSRKPAELSGGQSQRVAIGRALVQDSGVFLLDEPLSNLDAELRLHMRVEIAALHKRIGKTMIYVTHDQVEAMTLADRIVVLRKGVIEQVGTPLDLYRNPVNAFVAGFIGSPAMNFLDATRVSESEVALQDGTKIDVAFASNASVAVGERLRLGLRPEHLRIAESGALQMLVRGVESLGVTSYVYGEIAGHAICVESREGDPPKTGEIASLSFAKNAVYAFDQTGKAVSVDRIA